jgi:nicotinate-nucleotide adenylyltransferase
MRIGILGGTFDPPHLGHLTLATSAIEQLELDEVMFMPANRNPLKTRKVVTKSEDRIGMLEALVRGSGNPKLSLSDLEITRGGPSYAVDTLTELHMARPADYWFLMGSDSMKTLGDWKQPQRLIKLCRLGLVLRAPATEDQVLARIPPEFAAAIDFVKMPAVDISSTDLRDRYQQRKPLNPFIPPEVIKYIHSHRLYT